MAPKTELGKTALEVIVEILESYVEFIDVVEYATNFADMPYKIEVRIAKMTKDRKEKWKPILDKIKKDYAEATSDRVFD